MEPRPLWGSSRLQNNSVSAPAQTTRASPKSHWTSLTAILSYIVLDRGVSAAEARRRWPDSFGDRPPTVSSRDGRPVAHRDTPVQLGTATPTATVTPTPEPQPAATRTVPTPAPTPTLKPTPTPEPTIAPSSQSTPTPPPLQSPQTAEEATGRIDQFYDQREQFPSKSLGELLNIEQQLIVDIRYLNGEELQRLAELDDLLLSTADVESNISTTSSGLAEAEDEARPGFPRSNQLSWK